MVLSNLIDRSKWANLEFIRRAEGGALHSAVRSYGGVLSNSLSLPNPSPVNKMQAMVTVNAIAISDNQVYPHARIGGFFFHDPTAGVTFTGGDVYADISIAKDYPTGLGLVAVGRTFRCNDAPNCSQTDHGQYYVLGPVKIGEPHQLRIEFNALNNFVFTLDNNPPTLAYNGIPSGLLTYEWKGIGTHIGNRQPVPLGPGQGGYVDAIFDSVLINDLSTPISDASGMINRTYWDDSTLEFVREQISDGVYGLALRSYGSYANDGLNLVNGKTVKELQADLTVEQLTNDPNTNPTATPMAALEGNFYNVGGGSGIPGDQTGDIKALVGIRLSLITGLPAAFYNIVQCTQSDCNIYPGGFDRLYYHEDSTIPDLVGKPHRVSIRYDNTSNTFTFGFDGELTTPGPSDPGWLVPPPRPPTNSGPPNAVIKGPLTRVAFFNGPSGEGYVSAQFANIATVIDTDGDGVPDSQDNCPEVYNPDQKIAPCHTPGPGIPGIVCDPNPMCAPSTELPSGSLAVGPSPDGAIYVDVAVTFKPINGQTTPYVKPDPYNVVLRLFDHSSGTEIFADHVLCGPPCSLPNDLVYVSSPEDHSTTIELSQWFRNLQPGKQYDVAAEYVNYCNDLALNPDGTCPQNGDCITGIYQGQQPLNPQSFVLTSNKTIDQCPNSPGDAGGTGCPYAEKSIVTLFKVDIRNLPISHEHLSKVGVRVFDRHNADFLAVAGKSNPDWCKYGDIFEANKGSVSTCVTDSNGVCYAGESQKGDYLVIVRFNDLETGDTVYMGLPVYAWEFTLSKITVREFPIVKVYKNGVFKNYLGIGLDVVTQ